jgi:hypothetical protein
MRGKLNLTTVVLVLLFVAVLFARAKGFPMHDFRTGFSSGG